MNNHKGGGGPERNSQIGYGHTQAEVLDYDDEGGVGGLLRQQDDGQIPLYQENHAE